MNLSKRKLYEGEKITNFRELLERYEKYFPDKIAFKYKLSPTSKEILTTTYTNFLDDIKSFAKSLLQLGLQGKKVALIAPNRYEWCVSYLAITTADIVVVPLDKSLPNNEIEGLIIRSSADAVVYDSKYEEVFSKLRSDKSSNLQNYICMDNIEKENVINMRFINRNR